MKNNKRILQGVSIVWLSLAAIVFFIAKAHAQISPGVNSHNFQYLTSVLNSSQLTTTPNASAWNAIDPPKYYSLGVTTTAAGFVVFLEGSLDNSNWSTIAVTNSALGMVSNALPIPALYFRIRASTIAPSTSVTATAIGVW